MNKKYINYIIFIFFINIFFIDFGYSENICKYESEINKCVEANKPGASSGPNSINDFVCLESNNIEEITYQIVLDKKFREVDDDIDKYLSDLENNKGRYFGKDKTEDYLQGIQDIYDKFDKFTIFGGYGEYWSRYNYVCNAGNKDSILQETIQCLGGSTNISQAKLYFSSSTCMNLAESKLEIYRKVAKDILKSNKNEVRKDDRRKHTSSQKTKYDEIIDLFRINLSYLERILSKLVEKTRNVYK